MLKAQKSIPILLFFLAFQCLQAQIDYEYLSGVGKNKLDTMAMENAKRISEETVGVQEKEINPEEYIVGPGDKFEISILLGPETGTFAEATISPAGMLMIPEAGAVNLKELSLKEAKEAILKQINKYFVGDEIFVVMSEMRKLKVSVSGFVRKPISVKATAADRVSEVIERAGGVKNEASLRKITLKRSRFGKDTLLHIDLVRYYLLGDKDTNPYVLGGDMIIIPPAGEKNSIEISGDVKNPGKFEYTHGDMLSTLVGFGQGFLPSALLDSVEIARFDITGLVTDRFFLDLSGWKDVEDFLNIREAENNIKLQSGDRVYVRTIPDWNELNYVIIEGEVKYPGKYAINENEEKVADIIKRAGGITDDASPKDLRFIRQKEQKKRDFELERLLEIPYNEQSLSEQRYTSARRKEIKGAMSIDLLNALNDENSIDNIYMMHQDSIIIPQKIDYINIQGRVQNPGNVTFQEGKTYIDYIELAGGYGYRADENKTFIRKTNGEFVSADTDYILKPGDEILVPSKKEYDFMQGVTVWVTILGQVAGIAGVIFALSRR